MDDRLAAAFCARPVRVLGRSLRRYTLWHARTLDLIESPFVGAGRALTFAEFFLAVRICAADPGADLREVLRPPASIFGRLRLWWELLRWGRRFVTEYESFCNWLKDHNSRPRMFSTENSRPVKSAWYLYYVASLMLAGWTEERAWAASPAEAQWYGVACAEAQGKDVNLIGEAMLRAMKEAGHVI